MSYLDHLRTCSYCSGRQPQPQKPVVRIKGASSYRRERKLSELASVIKGTSYSSISYPESSTKSRTKAASSQLERQSKLRDLAKIIKG